MHAGKTLLGSAIARLLEVPFAQADCTTITAAGYVGDDAEDVVTRLLQNSAGNIERAQTGTLFMVLSSLGFTR